MGVRVLTLPLMRLVAQFMGSRGPAARGAAEAPDVARLQGRIVHGHVTIALTDELHYTK